ncbi:MAG: glycosyltransferase family 4 protein [Candidatus Moraniibacteriota bacterium]
MLITFISTEIPSLKKGAPVRIYNLIKQAIASGATVDLITLVQDEEDAKKLKNELGLNNVIPVIEEKISFATYFFGVVFRRVPPYFSDYRLSDLSDVVLSYTKKSKPDIIQLELLHSYYAIAPVIPELKDMGISIILDEHNVEFNAFVGAVETFSWLKRLIGLHIAPGILAVETEAVRAADCVFFCSEEDKSFFSKLIPSEKCVVIPNGVDCRLFLAKPLISNHKIIFTGGMYYPPNDDALKFYFHEIHTLIKNKVPDVTITLLGGEPSAWLKKLSKNDSSILIPGLVSDVREYIQSSRVCISPMRKGSGTSLKILEYMGSGKPIVSTKVGVRGISCGNYKDIIIANEPKAFAGAVVDSLRNDHLAKKLGENARKTAEEFYDWKIIGKKLFEVYNLILTEKP